MYDGNVHYMIQKTFIFIDDWKSKIAFTAGQHFSVWQIY